MTPTLANTTLLRSVISAFNKHLICPFQADCLIRRSDTLRVLQPHPSFQLVKIVRKGFVHTRSAVLMTGVGLTINVVAPANATPDSKLPVVVVCTLRMACCHSY